MENTQVTDKELSEIAYILRSSARLSAHTGAAGLIRLSPSYRFGEGKEAIHIVSAPCKRNEASELVRVYLDVSRPLFGVLSEPLRAEIEPFIIGVGQVRTRQVAEGFVISLGDDGQIHSTNPISDDSGS